TESLNRAVGRRAPPYRHLLWKNPHGGRNISTAILTRLPVEKDRTQLLGRRQRILEGHVTVNGHALVVIASHGTSRLRAEGAGRGTRSTRRRSCGRWRTRRRAGRCRSAPRRTRSAAAPATTSPSPCACTSRGRGDGEPAA